jgi:beta-N-acetylhexosaminidase
VVFPFAGTAVPDALRVRIGRGEVAGVILFGSNVRSVGQVRRLTRALQAIPRPAGLDAPLLVMTDQEGGRVQRLPGGPGRTPPQIVATHSTAVAEAEGRATARTLRAAGVNVDLAPVVDVARRGSQMEREGRSFGRSAATVTRYASPFVRGLVAGGVAATAKHFPGFGAAGANTDAARVTIRTPLAQLRRVDLPPFAAAVEAGAQLMMLSSAVYPALDRVPALLSRRIATTELRGRAGFRGVTVTDSLDAASLRPYRDVAVRAAAAGADLLLYADFGAAARAADELEVAIRRGRLAPGPARQAVARVLALRATLAR